MLNGSILSQLLTPRHRAAGLEVEESDHCVMIVRHEHSTTPEGKDCDIREIFTRFYINRTSPTITDLQEAADRVLEAQEGLPFQVEDFAG